MDNSVLRGAKITLLCSQLRSYSSPLSELSKENSNFARAKRLSYDYESIVSRMFGTGVG